MREAVGDLWMYPCDARCVTTNGVVKSNGELVMGAGVAKEALRLAPGLDRQLGTLVRQFGNKPYQYAMRDGRMCVSFPTKHHWKERSSLALIDASARRLVEITDSYNWKTVAMPRPGCGLGGLRWEDVRKVIAPILDDRFVVLTPPNPKR